MRTEKIYRTLLGGRYFDDTKESGIIDAITDIIHLCDEYGVDFDKAVVQSKWHYQEERKEMQHE